MTDTTQEIAVPEAVDPTHDAKGRPLPHTMSDRDMLVEVLYHLRTVADTVEELSDSPMVRALQGGGNPLMAMIGRG